METKIIKINNDSFFNKILNYPAKVLKDGGLVAFPTETVYGLGADALNSDAIKKIFEAKGRPADNPLILHISDIETLDKITKEYGGLAKKVISKFWPGPLTIVFRKKDIVPDIVTGGLDTVAVRMPSNKIAKKLIKLADTPIAAPSANISGRPSPTNVNHVIDDLSGEVECIIDGGECSVGLESTVLDLSNDEPMILRPGKITFEQLKEVISDLKIAKELKNEDIDEGMDLKSPGMKYTHYSPNADVFIIETKDDFDQTGVKEINKLIKTKFADYNVGVLCTDDFYDDYQCDNKISLGSRDKLDKIANKLFFSLRKFDEIGVDIILAESFASKEIGLAIMNRLKKSAGFKIFKV
ncbi:MAG: L-threonylcarbamoyladenylate synthase [Bacillota bacterium]